MINQKLFKSVIYIYILTLILTLSFSMSVAAEPEPLEYEGEPIVDPHEYFENNQKNRYNEIIAASAYNYVLVFLDQVDQNGFDVAQELYEQFELEGESVLFLITVNDNALYYAYDSKMSELGLSDELVEVIKEDTFVSPASRREYLTGIHAMISALDSELDRIQNERETADQITVNEDRSASLEQRDATAMPWWLKGLFVLFVLMILAFLSGILYRRRILKQVDQIEEWKIQIESRSFSTEFARIKDLKLSGEMERKFEGWKSEWEKILNESLPDVEELLLDIEDYAYSFRFLKSSSVLSFTRQRMEEIDQQLEAIVRDMDQFTSSEKQNREKMMSLHEEYQLLRSKLQHAVMSLGVSYPVWEEKLKNVASWFEKFDDAQENGDYVTANDYIQAIEDVFKQIDDALERMPVMIERVEQEIPRKIQELEDALQEMKEKGYVLSHTQVDKQFEDLKKGKSTAVTFMENGQIEQLKAWIKNIEENIESIYNTLEEEVKAKSFVLQALEQLPEQKASTQAKYNELKVMIQETKASYTWETEWDETIQEIDSLQEECQQLFDTLINYQNPDDDYLTIRTKVFELKDKNNKLIEAISVLNEHLKRVREDELNAKDMAKKLKSTLVRINSIIRKSNLPGIPQHLQSGQEMAEDSLNVLMDLLHQIPLDMVKVDHQLQEAKAQIESVTKVAQAVIEQATRTEQLIPYANRYRRTNPDIVPLLEESERAFRQLQFRESLEYVEQALDRVDPSWRDQWQDNEVREA